MPAGDLFKYGRAEMQRRWGVLQEIGASSQRLSFQVRLHVLVRVCGRGDEGGGMPVHVHACA